MYQSPIEIIHGELEMQLEGEVYKAVQRVGVTVDKEELLKALQYDRGQYSKGYGDGYANAIEEFAEAMKKKYPICTNDFGMVINESAHKNIDEITNELKGE